MLQSVNVFFSKETAVFPFKNGYGLDYNIADVKRLSVESPRLGYKLEEESTQICLHPGFCLPRSL